jgi:hypothetical protein
VLNNLVDEKKCCVRDEFYSLSPDITKYLEARLLKEEHAKHFFKKLPFYTKLIKSFPFVRAIAISGSLSKNIMYDDDDIDYFIVTAPNRLWISRTLLILFKKVFLLNSKKYFCVNYFVDENNLKIVDENIFTAIEITYLLPVYNRSLIDELKEANSWTKQYFPNFKHPIEIQAITGKNYLKGFIEWILGGWLGNRIDLFFMMLTYKKWISKFRHFDATKFALTMRTNRGISKHHPQDFQNRVLKEYNIRLNKLNIVE